MGGLDTEIDAASTDLVLEAAHFDPVAVARMARRHKLTSEASKRFERGVDPELPPDASTRAVGAVEPSSAGAAHAGVDRGAAPDGDATRSRWTRRRPARTAGCRHRRRTWLRAA